jgi:hypothetical protein
MDVDDIKKLPDLDRDEGREGERILCSVVDYVCEGKWTTFAIKVLSENSEMYQFSDKLYKIYKCAECKCGEKSWRAKFEEQKADPVFDEDYRHDLDDFYCKHGWDLRGREIVLEFDGANWEGVKVAKLKRCRVEGYC